MHAFARHGDAAASRCSRRSPRGAGRSPGRPRCSTPAALRLATPAALGASRRRSRPALVEPLSARELEVLRLLDTELDGPEIARHLFVSVNTLRTHTKSIYTKLGVNNRRAAVRRGRELGLLTGSR